MSLNQLPNDRDIPLTLQGLATPNPSPLIGHSYCAEMSENGVNKLPSATKHDLELAPLSTITYYHLESDRTLRFAIKFCYKNQHNNRMKYVFLPSQRQADPVSVV